MVGYGKNAEGQEYWIGRNSWGTYWGMYGFFYMTMEEHYDLGITQDCIAAIPTYNKQESDVLEEVVDKVFDTVENIIDEIDEIFVQ